MRPRSVLTTAVAAIALSAIPLSAQAKSIELIDRSVFDGTPVRTASALELAGPTAGPLGGFFELTVTAADGTLPTVFGSCEPVDVAGVLTVSPGEVLTVHTHGEACAHIIDGTLQVNSYFDKKDVSYEGSEHKKAAVVGDGLIAAAHHWYGGQASFSGTVRW
ncbi:MAG: hypothetical protein QOF58_1840 [Pseudonocardiales bacterium]|nr:hypothetical protein [Pseudonocardiales bacterium]